MVKTTDQIDLRIERLKLLLRRLRAERRVALLRQKHHQIKSHSAGSVIPKGVYL
jgi:hypothetical protein